MHHGARNVNHWIVCLYCLHGEIIRSKMAYRITRKHQSFSLWLKPNLLKSKSFTLSANSVIDYFFLHLVITSASVIIYITLKLNTLSQHFTIENYGIFWHLCMSIPIFHTSLSYFIWTPYSLLTHHAKFKWSLNAHHLLISNLIDHRL